jgi:hypothetical protein
MIFNKTSLINKNIIMKFIKNNVFKFSFLLTIFILISCENDQLENETVTSKNRTYPDVTTFLNNQYPSGFSYGDVREFNYDGDAFVVKEVFERSSTQVDAFINLTNGNFTHFLELDRSNNIVLIDDFGHPNSLEFETENSFAKSLFNEGFLSNLEYQKDLGRFWGWSCSVERQPSLNPADCYRTCCYKILFGSVYCDDYSCDDLPGSDPDLPSVN